MLDRLTIERMTERAGDGPILVALSGGGDSVALLHLLADQLGAGRLSAVVIDHGLREGSAADAERAAQIAQSRRVAVSTKKLTWTAAANRAHGAAREARYAALCDAARAGGARVIATGHTRDDQAETVLLRGERGSGLRGLAAMRMVTPAPIWPEGRGLWLARPLLSARREKLRAYLRERDATWIEDPANANEAYARVRARRLLAALEGEGLHPMRLAALAERLAPYVAAIDAGAAALIEAAASFDADEIALDRAGWAADAEVRWRALAALITAAGAHSRGPTASQVAVLDQALGLPNFEGATLAGALVQPRGARVVIRRDRGALAGRADGAAPIAPLPLAPNVQTVWDRRVALTMREPGWSVVFERGEAVLARGAERAPLTSASPQWLLRERVSHVLGMD